MKPTAVGVMTHKDIRMILTTIITERTAYTLAQVVNAMISDGHHREKFT